MSKAKDFIEAMERAAGVPVPGKKRPPGVKGKLKKKPVPGATIPKRHTAHKKRESVRRHGLKLSEQRGKAGQLMDPVDPDIKKDMAGFPRKATSYPRLRLAKVESAPAPPLHSFTFRGVIQGETANYRTYVQFMDVKFCEKASKDCPETAETMKGKVFYKKPSLKANPIKAFCECEDFKFVWSKQLFDSKALMGNFTRFEDSPFRYTRKTPPPEKGGLPYRNPEKHLGYCKHVNSLLLSLRDSKRIEA